MASRGWADEPQPLPEVTVEASRLDAYLPARTYIDRDELIDSHKSDLTEVIDLTPGLNVRRGGRGEPRLDLRGFDQRATLFVLDGVPVYDPYNGIINLDLFPIEMLGSVEITRGASSSLYGPNGLAGTVSMTTLQPQTPRAAASAQWRDSNFWDARSSVGGAGGAWSGLVGGRYLTSDGFPLSGDFNDRPATRRRFEDGGLRLNSDREDWSAFAAAGYQYAERGSVRASVLASDSAFGIPPSTTAFLPPFRRNDGQELLHAQSALDQQLWPGLDVGAGAFYSSYDSRESEYDGPDFAHRILQSDARSDEVGALGRVRYEWRDRNSLSAGVLIRRAEANISDSSQGTLARPDFITSTVGVEDVYALTDRIALLAGLSWDAQTGNGRGTDWELDPQGGVSVDFGRFGSSRAAVSRKIRFPTLRELYDPVQGNQDLVPEKALTYEIGHRIAGAAAYAEANLFRSDVKDLIENEGSDEMGQSVNLQKAILQGAEVAGGVIPTDWLRLDVNYTYLDAEARSPSRTGSNGYSRIQHRPQHRFNGIVHVHLPYAVELRLEGLYTSDQIDHFESDVKIGGFGLFNAQVSRRFADLVELFAGATNLLDEDYEERLGTPQPGRWVFVGLRITAAKEEGT
jgi:outer membrane cobalamin receptor